MQDHSFGGDRDIFLLSCGIPWCQMIGWVLRMKKKGKEEEEEEGAVSVALEQPLDSSGDEYDSPSIMEEQPSFEASI
ncbi:hypothetical protein OIU85_019688 [Salix viminalis]|uniref:Uncharacterized protein n=1 Tax=Salix viminalis TaxID=40686 RepID=A0A9Q0UWS3_SALVM|nr:hypothetical protein OIU85_019688 [Salix viminalis]